VQEPFVVPGCEDDPEQPLCPWRDKQQHHEHYYRDVGGMENARTQFSTRVPQPEKLSRKGQLVVVTGPERSGKTSLINWCAHAVKTNLPTEMKGIIYDLTNVCSGERMTVKKRMSLVCKAVVDEVLQLRPDELIRDRLLRNQEDPDSIFRLLYRVHVSTLHGKGVFIILLPPLDYDTFQREINHYLRIVQPGMILMHEHSVIESGGQHNHGQRFIRLRLGFLGSGEASLLVESWPGELPEETTATSEFPALRRDELAELDRFVEHSSPPNITAGNLLLTLRRVYKSRSDGTSRFSELNYVGHLEIIETMFQALRSHSTGTQHP
jgi:hypothetical protein